MRICLSGADWRVTDMYPSEWAWLPLGREGTDLDALSPPPQPWRRAIVPGDVQSDLLDTGEFTEPWRDLQSRCWEWTSQRDWIYRKDFALPADLGGHRASLRFEGVDYACHVFLNGVSLGSHAGSYVPFELDATAALRPGDMNRLVVVVEHAPAEPDQQAQIGWTGKVRLWKPRFAYKWDWCTRLNPLGIHDDVWLECWDRVRLTDLRIGTDLDLAAPGICRAATVSVSVRLDREASERITVQASLYTSEGTPVAREAIELGAQSGSGLRSQLELRVEEPKLWWPNGYGEQAMYRVRVDALGQDGQMLDTRETRAGFRDIRAVRNYGAEPEALPYTLEVNGRRIFAKGWNWAPINQLYGRPDLDRYTHAVRLAREAHCSLLRVWGGGLLERELFYDLCDEAGILVWQEFPQSSSGVQNEPARDADHVAYCVEQARQMVPRRMNHPSLAIWCGGNELMDAEQKPNGVEHPVLGALGRVVAEESPGRIYLPASPSGPAFGADPKLRGRMHDVHGHWLYLGDPEHYAFYNEIDPLFHSEFGCEGTANLRALQRFLVERNLWPPDRTNPAWIHHGAWWLHREKVDAAFGPVGDLRTYVFASQWLQHEGLRYAAEASRRRKWRTSGCAPWQLNESWPNTSCTNCLGYFGDLRPAYWAMRGAYAPVSVSLRYDSLRWTPGAVLRAEVWVNASGPVHGSLAVRWSAIGLMTQAKLADGCLAAPVAEQAGAYRVGTLEVGLPEDPCLIGIILEADGPPVSGLDRVGLQKRYLFSTHADRHLAPLLAIPATRLDVSTPAANRLVVRCTDDSPAPLVALRADGLNDHSGPYLSWGYAPFLVPGDEVSIEVSGPGEVEVAALNAEAARLRFQ